MIVDEDYEESAFVYIFDQRTPDTTNKKIEIGGIFSFLEFFNELIKKFPYGKGESFVITTTNRIVICDDESFLSHIESGDTLYLLKHVDQELYSSVFEKIDFQPHYDTLIKSGVYEYYASEGSVNPLPFAFAELIDNALAATAHNSEKRNIDLKIYFNDVDKQYVMSIQDNGVGMSPRQLNNWAVYRLSKFNRRDRHIRKAESEPQIKQEDGSSDRSEVSKSLNSDISWFGVGGKQAIFFIGGAVRVITRSKGECDVHEFVLSKQEFRKKEANKESIYSGYIKNRQSGDTSHIPLSEKITKKIINDEQNLPHRVGFTNIVISNIDSQHISYIRDGFEKWTRQLAHIYHYYIHGTEGNTAMSKQRKNVGASDVNITVSLQENGKRAHLISLNEIENDQETLFIRTACDTFEFEIETADDNARIEGIVRYHPFLYDKETYPVVNNNVKVESNDDDEDFLPEDNVLMRRGNKPIFQSFWNGRLIPYTFVQDFDWCKSPRKRGTLPIECYERISGCLFTNDKFKVSTNKLTFIDLDTKLKNPAVTFYRVILGERQVCNLHRQFYDWLKECHEKYDKQIKFLNFIDHILHASRQTKMLWTAYEAIEWEGKLFKTGQLIRSCKMASTMFGKIQRFLLLGQHDGDTFAVGGEVEIVREPLEIYGETVNFSLTKMDRTSSKSVVQRLINSESANIPAQIVIASNGSSVTDGSYMPLGSNISDMKVKVLSNKNDSIDKLITSSGPRKLLVEQKVYLISAKGSAKKSTKAKEISCNVSSFPYTFKPVRNLQIMGQYSIDFQVLFASNGSSVLGDGKELPSLTINFSITEAPPFKFMVGVLDSPLCIGTPFNILLDLQDKSNNPAKAIDCGKPVLKSSGLDLTFDDYTVTDNSVVINNVIAAGKVESQSGENFDMSISLPKLKQKTQSLKVRMLPGKPTDLMVQSVACDEDEIEIGDESYYLIRNRCKVSIEVAMVDQGGNITSIKGKCKFQAKFSGNFGIQTFVCDKKGNNSIATLSGKINVKKLKDETNVTAKISVQGYKGIEPLEILFLIRPSFEPHSIVVYYQDPCSDLQDENMKLKAGQGIYWHAGETISNLTFELYDEAGRIVDVTNNVAERIKLNWIGQDEEENLNVQQGELPDVTVPLNTNDSKFCQIVYSGNNNKSVQFSFFVKPVAGEPQSLKCDILGSRELEIGVCRDELIKVAICDKHHNELVFREDKVDALSIHGTGLDVGLVLKNIVNNCMILSGIQFNQGPIGSKELTLEYKQNDVILKNHVVIQLTPGTPVMMEVTGWPSFTQPLVIASGSKVKENVVVQLLDGWGNKSIQTGVRVVMSKDNALKLSPTLGPQLTDGNGLVKFSKFAIMAKKGEYSLQPRAVYNHNAIEGPKLKLNVLPNTETPVNLKVQCDKSIDTVTVGTSWPEFKIKVLTEEGECVTSEVYIQMGIWKSSGKKTEKSIPSNAELHKFHLSEPDIAVFYEISSPKIPGSYNIAFRVTETSSSHSALLSSPVYKYNVVPGAPIKIVPVADPGIPTVSNAKLTVNRTIIRSLKLRLLDEYGNQCSHLYSGNIKITIEVAQETLKSNAIPHFEGKCKTLTIPLKSSVALLQNICLKENCPGIDASEYILKCDVNCPALIEPLEPYCLQFMFYNDVNKQQRMAALSKQSEALKKDIESYESLFSLHDTLLQEMKKSERELKAEKVKILSELRSSGMILSENASNISINDRINIIKQQQQNLSKETRRTCRLQEYPGKGADIIGKVGHLALIEDDDIAKVLSWHLMGDFDCLITLTTSKAREVYNCTGGMQQVLPFDSIYKKNLDDNRPLPHKRIQNKSFKPCGNPIYARNALIFPKHEETCKVVFGMLIGDTIIMDSLAAANQYRKEVVKFTYCPTILTRTGERIRSNGKFGGSQNKITSIEKLKGCVFGAPLAKKHQTIVNQERHLERLKVVTEELNGTAVELQIQESSMNTEEMLTKRKEHEDAVRKLTELEKKIGVTSSNAESKSRKHDIVETSKSAPKKKRSRYR